MRKIMEIMLITVSVVIQVLTILIYSFTETQIPPFVYLAVWCACGLVIFHYTKPEKEIIITES